LTDITIAGRHRGGIVANNAAFVVIDADKVDRLFDQLEVRRRMIGPRVAIDVAQLFRVRAEKYGVEILPVPIRVGTLRSGQVVGLIGRRILRFQIDHDADLTGQLGAESLHSSAVGPQQVVRRMRCLTRVLQARRMKTVHEPGIDNDPRLIDGGPHRHAITKRAIHEHTIIGEPARAVAIQPATAVVERGRQVPVIQRRVGHDFMTEQLINQAGVEIDALLVGRAAALRQDAAPGDAEAIRPKSQFVHKSDVGAVAMIVVACDVASMPEFDAARLLRETVPV
jgi:hypothetical protein